MRFIQLTQHSDCMANLWILGVGHITDLLIRGSLASLRVQSLTRQKEPNV